MRPIVVEYGALLTFLRHPPVDLSLNCNACIEHDYHFSVFSKLHVCTELLCKAKAIDNPSYDDTLSTKKLT